jgi:hypothetical protein
MRKPPPPATELLGTNLQDEPTIGSNFSTLS